MTEKKKESIKDNWIWKLYFLEYLSITVLNARFFFSSQSPIYTYHRILLAFDPIFRIPFCFNGLSVILNVLGMVPFYAFIYRKNFLTLRFWRYFFALKLVLDVAGRPYEALYLKSVFHQSPAAAAHLVVVFIVLQLPGYVAIFKYAFKK